MNLSSKKQIFADMWSASGLARMALRYFAGLRGGLLVLAYHRIADSGAEGERLGDPELISATPADFHWQMELVSRHFQPITFREVLDCMDGGNPLPDRAIVVTFDDGHVDNYHSAFPILRSLGVPATIFLSTGYIGTRTPFWFDKVARLFAQAPPGRVALVTVPFEATLQDLQSRRLAAENLLGLLKRIANPRRLDCLAELDQRLSKPSDASDREQPFALSWPQVREMASAGIEFGSHTVSHPILTQLDDAQLHEELANSRQAIATMGGLAADVIAYPVGKRFAFDERVIAACKACGYRLGVSYETGTNPDPSSSRYSLKRLAVERYTNRAMFESMLSLPAILA